MKKQLLFGLASCSFLLSTAQVNLTNGLVGCYPFNGDANDHSGGNHNGTVSGATLAPDRFGNPNSAYHFNGFSDYISVPAFNTMVPQDEITVSVWGMADGYTSNIAVLLVPDISADRLVCGMNYVGGPFAIFDYGDFQSGGRMIFNTGAYVSIWEHYVFVTSASGNIKSIYRNGTLLTTSAYALSLSNRNRSLYFGSYAGYDGTNIRWHGYLDDIRIYNRALSPAEIANLYNLPSTATCSSVNGEGTLKESGLLIYPLQGETGKYQINLGSEAVKGSVVVYNMMGQVICEKQMNTPAYGTEQIDLGTAPAGIYLLNIVSGTQRYTWKFER